jgi:putative RecB family exonuclease
MAATRVVKVAVPDALSLPPSISPTSASTWRQCELKYTLTYVMGWQEAGTVAQLIGNTSHHAIELLYALDPADRTRARASELLHAVAPQEAEKAGFTTVAEQRPALERQVLDACEDSLDGLFELENPATVTVGAEGLEVWVSATLYGAPVRGRIDRVYDASGAYVVADYKTGKVPKSAYTQKAFFGLWTYAAALAAADPDRVLPDRIELLYLIGRERLARPVLRDVALAHVKDLARIWSQIGGIPGRRSVEARTGPLCGWCAFETACPARTRTKLPPVGTAEHDRLLVDLGLHRRDRRAVATTLERVDTPTDAPEVDVR